MSPAAKSTLITRWAGDGFTAMLGWYRAMTENTHWAHESKLLSDAFKLQMPVLFVGGKRDAVAPAVLGDLATKPLCSDYEGVVLDCGHWVLREKGEEWGDVVRAWVGRKF
jgi:soluble epoxide hydrolase / lipid-phosphate phosphatase